MITKPKVKLITHTPEPEKVIACAAKLCYSSKVDIDSLMESLTPESTEKFVKKLISLNHESPTEHVSFTFAIEGVSRAFLAQITRHRVGVSFSVRSQRYCNEGEFDYVVPSKVYHNEEALKEFDSIMQSIKGHYNHLQEEYGLPNEDARAILPNSCATRMIITMNLRELNHFFNERCCNRAQGEIRQVANEMLKQCREVSPILFENSGAKCDRFGYCPEGNMCCGKAPTMAKLLEVYKGSK